MKKFFIIFLMFTAALINAKSQENFDATYTDYSGCIYYHDQGDGWPAEKTILICPPEHSYNYIRFWFHDLNINSWYQFIEIDAYDPVTGASQYITGIDVTYIPGPDEVLITDARALIIHYYPDPNVSGCFWELCYEVSNLTQTTNNYTAKSGIFDDGSGTNNYITDLKGTYIIKPTDSDLVELSFTDFSLGTGDDVSVYNGETEYYPLIGKYTYSNLPLAKIKSTGKALCLVFNSDNTGTSSGWAVEYAGLYNQVCTLGFNYTARGELEHRTITLGTRTKSAKVNSGKTNPPQQKFTDNLDKTEIVIYPNPTRGNLKIDIKDFDFSLKSNIYVFGIAGNLVKQLSPALETNILDLSANPNGIYILRIALGDKVSEWKIIKE